MTTVLPVINAAIARLTYMASGLIGNDWRTGEPFVLWKKGCESVNEYRSVTEFRTLQNANDALRLARAEIERIIAEMAQLSAELSMAELRMACQLPNEVFARIEAAMIEALTAERTELIDALEQIEQLKTEDLYRGDSDNTAAFIARAALEKLGVKP